MLNNFVCLEIPGGHVPYSHLRTDHLQLTVLWNVLRSSPFYGGSLCDFSVTCLLWIICRASKLSNAFCLSSATHVFNFASINVCAPGTALSSTKIVNTLLLSYSPGIWQPAQRIVPNIEILGCFIA